MRSQRLAALVTVAATALAAGCSSSSGSTTTPPPYAHQGPDTVGVTTLQPRLGRSGARRAHGHRLLPTGAPPDCPDIPGSPTPRRPRCPPRYQGILPARYDTTESIDAYVGPPTSTKGPFPIVLFSHGYGGERLYYSAHLLAGIASWGYVVVDADYLERGLAARRSS